MLRWHLQQGRSAIRKSTKPARLAQNIDVFNFKLGADELPAIDALKQAGQVPDRLRADGIASGQASTEQAKTAAAKSREAKQRPWEWGSARGSPRSPPRLGCALICWRRLRTAKS